MDIFVLMYVLLFLIWGISANMKESTGRKFSSSGSFLVLWLIQSLRSTSTGTDLKAYIPFFDSSGSMQIGEIYRATNMEFGYQIYNELISHFISTNPNVFLAITAFIAIAPIAYIIYKYSRTPSLSFIIFASLIVYLFDFSGLRQAIAIGITALSFSFVVKKKIIPFALLVFLASTIHTSSILFLIAYPICNYFNLTPGKYILISIFTIIAIISLKSIAKYVVNLLFGGGLYSGYLNDDNSGAYMLLIMLLLLFLFTFMNMSKENNLFRAIIMLGVISQSLGLISSTATRLGYYFYLYFCLALPETIYGETSIKNKLILKLGVAAFIVFFFFYTTGEGAMGVVPYQFFWEQ